MLTEHFKNILKDQHLPATQEQFVENLCFFQKVLEIRPDLLETHGPPVGTPQVSLQFSLLVVVSHLFVTAKCLPVISLNVIFALCEFCIRFLCSVVCFLLFH